ncbi:MAG: hypothetical protein ABIO70_18760 [Pseudomonadota bacterium]
MPTWTQIKESWSGGWKALQAESLRLYEAAIRHSPAAYAERVKAFMVELAQARAHLDSIRAKLPNPPRTEAEAKTVANYVALERRYQDLAAGFWADAEPAREGVGVAPALIVAGVVVGVAAIAWAIAAWEYCVNLREQTALADRELVARVDASKEGRVLPPTTLPPPPPDPVKKAEGIGWLLVGGLVLAAGAAAVPVLLKKVR